jgi:hypothetical protein
MYEVNFLVWPLVYGVCGHAWGTYWGAPHAGAIAGVLVGFAIGVPMVRASFYDVEIVALPLLLVAFVVPGPWRRWYLVVLSSLPLLRLGVGMVRGGRGDERTG